MNKTSQKLWYYLNASPRRKIIDALTRQHIDFFKGSVLDIGGGRKRGNFHPPETERWVFADICAHLKPDVICPVEDMPFSDKEFDLIKATELFEHVSEPEKGLSECYRVLKKDGYLLMTMPFLFPVHGDPADFQRWTDEKLRQELKKAGFKKIKIIKMGGFFTVLTLMLKTLNKSLPFPFRHLGYILYPVYDFLTILDRFKFFKKNPILKGYTTGYFVLAQK